MNGEVPPGTDVVQASQTEYLARAKKSIVVAGATAYINLNLQPQ